MTRLFSQGETEGEKPPFSHKAVDWNKVKDLYWGHSLSFRKISLALGISVSSIQYNFKRRNLPARTLSQAKGLVLLDPSIKARHVANLMKGVQKQMIKPLLSPSPSLAYLVAALKGDGWVGHRKKKEDGYYSQLTSSEIDFVNSVANAMQNVGLHPHVFRYRKYFGVYAFSKRFVEWYTQLTQKDLGVLTENEENALMFIRGFYEAEGSVGTDKNSPWLRISNTNKSLLLLSSALSRRFGFKFNLLGPYDLNNPAWKPILLLSLYGRAEVLRFLDLVKPCIKRLVVK